MTTAYFQSVIDELNANCEKRDFPLDKSSQNGQYPFTQRSLWREGDIRIDEEDGELSCKESCYIVFHMDEYFYKDSHCYLCKTCKDILTRRVFKVFDRTNVQLSMQVNKLQEEVRILQTLVRELVHKSQK